jgi:hypothetical protein
MSTADGREIYVIGKQADGNREVVIVEDGATHDLPAAAKYTYTDQVARFPYELVA